MRGTVMNDEANNLTQNNHHKILIADDEKQIREMFKLLIETDFPNIQVDLVADGAEAVQCFSEGRHAVILMDLHMPIMDGIEAFREIEDLCETMDSEIPTIIFCTAYDPPSDVSRILKQYNKSHLLRKPIDNASLIEAIQKTLS